MTDKEKAIIMASTGICMLKGDKFQIFHKYIEDLMGRKVFTHEIGLLEAEIKEKSKADFYSLCAEDDIEEKQTNTAEWVALDDYPSEDWECDNCGFAIAGIEEPYRFCPNCGKKMWK